MLKANARIRRVNRNRRRRGRKLNNRQKQQVKTLIGRNLENKFFIANYTGSVSTTPDLQPIAFPAQGTTDNNRIGDEIKMKSLRIHLQILKNSAATTSFEFVRFVIFQWRPSSQFLAPSAAQLFLTDPSTGAISYRSFYSVDTKAEYSILYDKTWTFNGLPLDLTHQFNQYHNFNVSLRKAAKNIQFHAALTTGSHQLYYYIIGATAAGAGNLPAFNMSSQLFYSDS